MEFQEKIEILRERIEKELIPLINNDYVLWDCPYYSNIGDTLIWEGEREFLSKLPYKCLGHASNATCTFPELPSDTIILLQGGGNFGDLWRWFQDFRLEVIRRYPHNRIIVLPQSVCYQNVTLMQEDSWVMSGHSQLTLCVRDRISYDLLKRNFRNSVQLVPDMAFYISPDILARYKKKEEEKILFLKRDDKELVFASYSIEGKGLPIEVRDWPTQEKEPFFLILLYKLIGLCRCLKRWKLVQSIATWLADTYAVQVCRPLLLKRGINFISSYKLIYTTRLHVMILSILLHKKVFFFDNSYGKNRNLYDTWLSDLDGCKGINKK